MSTPLPLVPNVVKVVITNEGNDGRIADTVLHWVYGGSPPTSANCTAIAEAFWNLWVAQFTPTQPAQTSLSNITVTDLSTDTGGEGSYNNGGVPVPGTSAHGMLPYHTAFLLSKSIAQRYRGGHPRSYLPIGTTNDLNDDGDWKSSSYDPWVTSWETLVDGIVGLAEGATTMAEECTVSYYGGAPTVDGRSVRREVPLVYDIAVDGYTGSAKLATQRRRVRRTERRR